MTKDEVIENIRNGEIDLNGQSSFFGALIKGFIWNLNQQIKLRDKSIPHFIVNTGDETIYTEIKGNNETANPLNIENENYIYTKIPRCAISPKGITFVGDQCTNPYSAGVCQYEDDDNLITLTGEFRRISMTMAFELEYLLDSFTDYLTICQQIASKMAFVRTFNIVYMGQKIPCSYKIPDSFDGEYNIDFDFASTDDKRKKISLSIEVETVFPVFDPGTMMATDKYIKDIYLGSGNFGSNGSNDSTDSDDSTNPDGSSNNNHQLKYKSHISVYPVGGIDNGAIPELS